MDKSNQRVRNMFAEIAGGYDRMNHLLSMNVDHYWRWRTVRMVPPKGEAPILDLCTGTGDLALAYWKAAKRIPGPAPSITAADFCPEMLAVGREKKKSRRAGEELQFVEADAQALPFPSDHFQIVSVAFGLRNVADTDQGLREMTRVCRPGGKVAVLEFSQPTRQPMKAAYGWYFRNVLPRIGQLLTPNHANAYDYLPASVGEFPHGQELADRMTSAGLSNVWFQPLTFGIATLYTGTKPASDPQENRS